MVTPYSLDDLQSDIDHLANLLEVVTDQFIEHVPFVNERGERRPEMDKLNALVWIARDLGNALSEKVERNYQTLQTPRGVEGDAA